MSTAFIVFRLPLALVALYLSRDPVVNWIERRYDIIGLTTFTIDVFSTALTRTLAATLFLSVVGAALILQRFARPALGFSLVMVIAAVLLAASIPYGGSPALGILAAFALTVTNLWPMGMMGAVTVRRHWRRIWVGVAIGVAELAFFRRYALAAWPRLERVGAASNSTWRGLVLAMPGLLVVAVLAALLLDAGRLLPLERALRMDAGTEILLEGDLNGIEIDQASGSEVFVTGHGMPRVQKFPASGPFVPSQTSAESTGGAQEFAYDPARRELYLFNTRTRELMYLHADTLTIVRRVHLPDVSGGDVAIAVSPLVDAIIIASEADEKIGMPFYVVHRSTGEILDQRNVDSALVLAHPTKPLLYLSFFRHRQSVLLYDLEKRDFVDETPTDSRVERMAYWRHANELLLASPVESRVLRFDADSLVPKGAFDALFGVRTLAVDESRGLAVTASLVNGCIEVIDLATGQARGRTYLGPWLRAIALDLERGVAFVSSNGALYRLSYVS